MTRAATAPNISKPITKPTTTLLDTPLLSSLLLLLEVKSVPPMLSSLVVIGTSVEVVSGLASTLMIMFSASCGA